MKPKQRWGRLILSWLRIEQVYVARSLTSRLVDRDVSRAEPVRIPETGFPSLHGIVFVNCSRMEAVVCGYGHELCEMARRRISSTAMLSAITATAAPLTNIVIERELRRVARLCAAIVSHLYKN